MSRRRATAGGVAFSYTYQSTDSDTFDTGGVFEFSGVDIGTASSTRLVVVACHITASTSIPSLNNVTIGGAGATIHVNVGDETSCAAIASLVVTSGATADIDLEMANTNANRAQIDVYILDGYASSTPTDTASDSDNGAGTTISNTIDVESGGVAIFAATGQGTTRTHSWSSATEQYDDDVAGSGNNRSGALLTGPVSSHTETVTLSGLTSGRRMVSAAWA